MIHSDSKRIPAIHLNAFTLRSSVDALVACNAVVSLSENRDSHELAVCRPEKNPTESRPSLTLGWWLGTTKLARKPACGRLLPTSRHGCGNPDAGAGRGSLDAGGRSRYLTLNHFPVALDPRNRPASSRSRFPQHHLSRKNCSPPLYSRGKLIKTVYTHRRHPQKLGL